MSRGTWDYGSSFDSILTQLNEDRQVTFERAHSTDPTDVMARVELQQTAAAENHVVPEVSSKLKTAVAPGWGYLGELAKGSIDCWAPKEDKSSSWWGTADVSAKVAAPEKYVNGYRVQNDSLGCEFIETWDGSRAYLDMSGSPVQPNTCSSSSAGLFGSMDGFYGNSASSSASSLYGYSPAAESNSMAGFYGYHKPSESDSGGIHGSGGSIYGSGGIHGSGGSIHGSGGSDIHGNDGSSSGSGGTNWW